MDNIVIPKTLIKTNGLFGITIFCRSPDMSDVSIFIVVLIAGGFVKVFTTLQIFRIGLGFAGGAAGVLVFVVACVFALFVASAEFPEFSVFRSTDGFVQNHSENSFAKYFESRSSRTDGTIVKVLQKQLQSSEEKDAVSSSGGEAVQETKFSAALLAFVLGELRQAFELGVLFILPFLLIDIVVVHVLQLLSVTQIAAWSLSLPLKLLLFLAIDGWALLTQKLVSGYVVGG